MKPNGRPKGRREKTIQCRIGDPDRDLLQAVAQERGCSMSELVRNWVSEKLMVIRAMDANMRAVKFMEMMAMDVAARISSQTGMHLDEVMEKLVGGDEAEGVAFVQSLQGDFLGPGLVTPAPSAENGTLRSRNRRNQEARK